MQSIHAAQPTPAALSRHSSGVFSSPGKRKLVVVLLLVAVTLVVYRPLANHDFITYDDPYYVTQNLPVQSGFSWKNVAWAFTSINVANWHPVTWLSHMSDVSLFGLNPAGHHFMSLLWHTANVVLLFLLLYRGTGLIWASAFVAAVFAVHPLNVQSVAWVSERKNVLSTFFWFAALYVYGWYALKPNWRRYLLVLALFTAGLLSKAMLVTFPFVLLLLDYWPLRRMALPAEEGITTPSVPGMRTAQRRLSWLLLEKVPFVLLAATSILITYQAQRLFAGSNPHELFPWWFRIENALVSYADYLWKMIWPTRLTIFYPLHRLGVWQPVLSALVLAAVTVAVLRLRQRRFLLVGWLWYLGILVPVIGLIQVGAQAKADRYAYVPLIGVLVLITLSVAELLQRSQVKKPLVTLVALCIILALALDTRVQLGYWRDSISLFSRALEIAPDNNYIAHINLGNALSDAGRLGEAFPHLYFASQRFPSNPPLHIDMGTLLLRQGRPHDAIAEYTLALRFAAQPQLIAQIQTDLGNAYAQASDLTRAAESYAEAIRLDPFLFSARTELGALLYRQARLSEAATELQRSLDILPTARAWLVLGRVWRAQGKLNDAHAAFSQVLKMVPNSEEAKQEINKLRPAIN